MYDPYRNYAAEARNRAEIDAMRERIWRALPADLEAAMPWWKRMLNIFF